MSLGWKVRTEEEKDQILESHYLNGLKFGETARLMQVLHILKTHNLGCFECLEIEGVCDKCKSAPYWLEVFQSLLSTEQFFTGESNES
jgi:hypothetical protein